MNFLIKLYQKLFLWELEMDQLDEDHYKLTVQNIKKHIYILIFMSISLVYSYFIIKNNYLDQIGTVITSLLGVLFVTGSAWYVITFGTIPKRFGILAVNITYFLFASFCVSLAAVFIAASLAVPYMLPIFIFAFGTLYIASVKYDIMDALKLGIDEAIYKHAEAGEKYFSSKNKR